MRLALHAILEELHRLRATGIESVSISELGLEQIRVAWLESSPPTPLDPPHAAATPTRTAVSEKTPAVEKAAAIKAPAVRILPAAPVVSLPDGAKLARWEALRKQIFEDETCLQRVRGGKKMVYGVGNLEAKIMFVGEAPGAEEEIQGEPFVGPAGQLLTKMIAGMGLERADVYIGNIMSWRPDVPSAGPEQVGNRPPTDEEMDYCLPYLCGQIDVVQPRVLVGLGSTAARGLLGAGSFQSLGEVRGKWHTYRGIPLLITYHPSYILRSQSNRSKRMIWEDLLTVMEKAELPVSERQRGFYLQK